MSWSPAFSHLSCLSAFSVITPSSSAFSLVTPSSSASLGGSCMGDVRGSTPEVGASPPKSLRLQLVPSVTCCPPLSLLPPSAVSPAFSPRLPPCFPLIVRASVPGRVQVCVAHLKKRWIEIAPKPLAQQLCPPAVRCCWGDSARTPCPLAGQRTRPPPCFPARLGPGPASHQAPRAAGIHFISLAADEKPSATGCVCSHFAGESEGRGAGRGAELRSGSSSLF